MGEERRRSSALWRQVDAGGCARKLPAGSLRELAPWVTRDGERFMEDAAVVAVGAQEIVQTVDFITPLVPDPGDFGRIAATNAMSDVFVLGARPMSALAVACVPLGDGLSAFAQALHAARGQLTEEGCELVGGHSVVDAEPKLGFAIVGTTSATGRLIAAGARPGDALVLTKPIGVGLISSAYKSGLVTDHQLAAAVDIMVQPNSCVPRLVESPLRDGVRAATDVTGFGLFAHVAEMCRRSGVGATIDLNAIPLIEGARKCAEEGIRTSAFATNLEYIEQAFGANAKLWSDADTVLLTDPQTSGGAIIAVDPNFIGDTLNLLNEWGLSAAVIGQTAATTSVIVA